MSKLVKTVNEFHIVESDRLGLMAQANSLVESIVLKQVMPLAHGAFTAPEISEDETRAYTAALLFLERELNNGAKCVEVFDKCIEVEENID